VVDGYGQARQPHPVSAAGWQQIHPRGLYDTLTRIRREYASPEVMITENGVPDDASDSLATADYARIDFLDQHLRAVHQAIAEGCRVTGYHAWSLLDNFEWAADYTQRWGLVRVDFDILQRTPKASAFGTPPSPKATSSPRSSHASSDLLTRGSAVPHRGRARWITGPV
jgi:beta-glucosidase